MNNIVHVSPSEVKYIHERYWTRNKYGTLVENHFGGITFAYIVNQDGLRFSFAKCRNDERYNRSIGRDVSLNNLITSGIFIEKKAAIKYLIDTSRGMTTNFGAKGFEAISDILFKTVQMKDFSHSFLKRLIDHYMSEKHPKLYEQTIPYRY